MPSGALGGKSCFRGQFCQHSGCLECWCDNQCWYSPWQGSEASAPCSPDCEPGRMTPLGGGHPSRLYQRPTCGQRNHCPAGLNIWQWSQAGRERTGAFGLPDLGPGTNDAPYHHHWHGGQLAGGAWAGAHRAGLPALPWHELVGRLILLPVAPSCPPLHFQGLRECQGGLGVGAGRLRWNQPHCCQGSGPQDHCPFFVSCPC